MSDPQNIMSQSPFIEQLGLELVQCGDGRAETALRVRTPHLRSRGIMHGGVAASLLDSTMGLVAASKAPDGHFTVTVQLSVNFVRPAWLDEELRITAELEHAGQQTAVAQGEIRNAHGVLVALSTGTFMFVKDPAPGRVSLPQHADSGTEK